MRLVNSEIASSLKLDQSIYPLKHDDRQAVSSVSVISVIFSADKEEGRKERLRE